MDDPFTLAIIKDKLVAVATEMGEVLARTSMSPIVYEVLDFACGITDAQGRVLAQTNGLTLFTGTFGPQVRSVLERFGDALEPGDVFATNDPYSGGTHVCDVCLVTPVFEAGAPIAFAVCVAHWIELGGSVPGSIPPDATEIFQEGLRLPCLRVARAGTTDPTLLAILEANVRLPRTALADLDAGLAAVRVGAQGVAQTCARYGGDTVKAAAAALLDQGEALVAGRLAEIPVGVYRAEDVIDGDGISDDPIPVRVEVTLADGRMTIDFTGSAPSSRGPVNCTRGALESACKTAFRAVTDPHAPSNDGCFRALEVVCPDGTVFTAGPPTPTGWYYEATAFATELVWRALAPVVPDRLGAGSYVSLAVSYLVGRDAGGETFVLAEPNDGGWGADHDRDGESGLIATTDGDTYNLPVEVVESRFPVVVERYALDAPTAAGAGRRRGGLGLVREYRVAHPGGAVSYGSMGAWRRRPWGLRGGTAGSTNGFEYVNGDGSVERLGRVAHRALEDGAVVRMVTGTGGGWGDPREREPDRVLADVLDGYVDVATARAVYAVVLDPAGAAVDAAATAELRAAGA